MYLVRIVDALVDETCEDRIVQGGWRDRRANAITILMADKTPSRSFSRAPLKRAARKSSQRGGEQDLDWLKSVASTTLIDDLPYDNEKEGDGEQKR